MTNFLLVLLVVSVTLNLLVIAALCYLALQFRRVYKLALPLLDMVSKFQIVGARFPEPLTMGVAPGPKEVH